MARTIGSSASEEVGADRGHGGDGALTTVLETPADSTALRATAAASSRRA
jgi:hypothetical protein